MIIVKSIRPSNGNVPNEWINVNVAIQDNNALEYFRKYLIGYYKVHNIDFKFSMKDDDDASVSDFTSEDILEEIDADMRYWGVPQGEIESMIQDWRNRFLILRRERLSI